MTQIVRMTLLFSSLLFTNSYASEAELYGSIRYGVQSQSNSIVLNPHYLAPQDPNPAQKGFHQSQNKRHFGLEDEGSHIGIKGRHDIGEGNAIIYQLEWGPEGIK